MRTLILIFFVFYVTELRSQESIVDVYPISMFCDSAVSIKVTGDYKKVFYTTDGSIPTYKSKRYRKPILVNRNSFFLFKIYYDKRDTIITRSYIFSPPTQLPVLSIGIPDEDLWDDEKGIYTRGKDAFFSDSTGHWENCNFQKKWEKAVYMIYLDTLKKEVVNQQCGLRIFGESTRRQPDKSMKIVARKKYGKNRFVYPFFEQKPHIEEYKQLVIRTSGNDYNKTRFKDVLNAYLMQHSGIDYMAFQPIKLYVNGEYWGLYNLREKINKHYLYYNHDAHIDSSTIVMGRWVRQHGDRSKYMEMYHWFLKLDTMDDEAYKKAQSYIYIKNYATYRAFQIYTNNVDSRGNVRYWSSKDKDGRFRMILYDTDLGFSRVSRDYLKKCLSPEQTDWFNNTWSTLYFRKLMQNNQFKNEFINQFTHLLNTTLSTDTVLQAIEYLRSVYKDELPRDTKEIASHLKNSVIPIEKWNKNIKNFRFFAVKRPEIAREEIKELLAPKGTYVLRLNLNHAKVSINDNTLIRLPFSGIYFKEIPLPARFVADSGYVFSRADSVFTTLDTIFTSIKDTISFNLTVKKIKNDKRKDLRKVLRRTPTVNKEKPPKSNKNPLWLIAWIFIGLGGSLLLVYFILRVKD